MVLDEIRALARGVYFDAANAMGAKSAANRWRSLERILKHASEIIDLVDAKERELAAIVHSAHEEGSSA